MDKTAQELDVRWPEPECLHSPTDSHYFVAQSNISKGVILVCRHCFAIKWLPSDWAGCLDFSADMIRYGVRDTYWRWLDRRPRLKELLVKLQDIGILREKLPNQRLLEVIVGIVADHNLEYRDELEYEGIVFKRKKMPIDTYPD